MTMLEAAALRAIRPYYEAHDRARCDDPAGLTIPCPCDACRHARIFADLLGVSLSDAAEPSLP